jgi:DNA-binding response OmpR family regulator
MLAAVESALPIPSKHPSASSILVVDDEDASGELVATLLRSQGYLVRLAKDGKEALPIIARGGVDLLLLDLMMSKMDGVEVCAYVRNELRDAFLPIVITTSLNDRESRIRAKEAGADDVLVKPIDGLELLVRIDSLLRTRAQLGLLMRDRDRAISELFSARTSIQTLQRTLRSMEGESAAVRGLLERQRDNLEHATERLTNVAEAGEQLQLMSQLTSELSQGLEQLAGAATGTVVRMPDGLEIENDSLDERTLATAIK